MERDTISDLVAFLAVAREGSFTRAATRLGLSQSALSHIIRSLETRLGLRVLARTTRSVAPTAAGQRLLDILGPNLDGIDTVLHSLADLRDRPSGTIRITAGDHAVDTVLMPKAIPFLNAYPDVKLEVIVDVGLTDIVTERFDAGIRMGEQVDRDMVAVKIGPDLRMAVVGSPAYFATRKKPVLPQQLTEHTCINLHLQTLGASYAWEFAKGNRSLRVRVDGQLTFNRVPHIVDAARAGMGLCMVPQDRVAADLAQGHLVRVLDDWCAPFSGYHLYYPSRRQPSAAFARLISTLRVA